MTNTTLLYVIAMLILSVIATVTGAPMVGFGFLIGVVIIIILSLTILRD